MCRCPVTRALLCRVALCVVGFMPSGVAFAQVSQPVSPDLFGELVDVVTPGYLHWSSASGDTVDPDDDRNDSDNNFGEHAGAVDAPTFSSQAKAYAQGSVAEEFVYAYGDNTVSWQFKVPGPGQYVMVTRLWRELQETTNAVFSYRAGETWTELPAVEDIEHWGDYGNPVCFSIEVPEGERSLPVRVRATSGRCLIFRVLLGRKREGSPFADDAEVTHPSLHFRATDLPELQEKISSGPPKLAYDYMTQQVQWYTNTLNRGENSWQPKNSAHHVSRSIAQTAFMYVLTHKPEYLDTVTRMIETVMDWPRDANAIVDQRAGYNILARGRQLSALAMAYDWLYDEMDVRKRRRLRRFLDEEANRLYLYNGTCVGDVESGNWDPWIGAGYGMAGIALRDEHHWARDWVDSMRRIFRANLHRSGEDFGYFNSGFVKALDFAISLRTATREDLFAPEARRLRALLDYRMMLLTPQRDGYPQFGDAHGSNDPVLALCTAAFLRDPLAQWYIHHLSCGSADQVKSWGWQHMMPVAVVTMYDATLEEEPPGEPRLALARSFADEPDVPAALRAVTIMRTGYDRATDVQLALRCGDYAGWHGHPDQGSFVLNAYGDHLVIDRALGAPYGTPASKFSKSAQAHSTVLIDDKGQVPYSGPVYYDREAGHTGPLLHASFIDYVLADSTVAYRKNPPIRVMDHARRHFLFVRKPDRHAYIVIFDDLQQDERLHDYDWLVQTDTEHTIETEGPRHYAFRGDAELYIFTVAPNSVEMSQTDSHDIWRTLKLMNTDEVRRGLFLNVLYPKSEEMALPEVARVEGKGFVGAQVGSDDLFLFATEDSLVNAHGISTDGDIAVLGREDGEVAWFLCAGGARMEADGENLFASDQPVTAAFNAARDGCIVTDGPASVSVSLGGAAPVVIKVEAGTTAVREGFKL